MEEKKKQNLSKIKNFQNWLAATHLTMGGQNNINKFDRFVTKKYQVGLPCHPYEADQSYF